jgi:hypothetical protein
MVDSWAEFVGAPVTTLLKLYNSGEMVRDFRNMFTQGKPDSTRLGKAYKQFKSNTAAWDELGVDDVVMSAWDTMTSTNGTDATEKANEAVRPNVTTSVQSRKADKLAGKALPDVADVDLSEGYGV